MDAIYLDYMATTPIDPLVLEAMYPVLHEMRWCANASSIHHHMGQEVVTLIDTHRGRMADMLNASPEELLFTSGATESNNLALIGAARFYQRQGRHLVTLATEHKAVLNVFEALEREGFEVTYLMPGSDGLLDITDLEKALRPETILVSIMQVNNEIGVIQDIENIAYLLSKRGILFHVDAAQGFGPLGIDLKKVPISMMSFSAHKVYGPKGIGALYVRKRPRVQLQPMIFGGGQEYGIRPGTLATHQIVGMSKAFELTEQYREVEQNHLLKLREAFLDAIGDLSGWKINGSMKARVAGNLNLYIDGVDGAQLINGLYPLIVSSQSACSASLGRASHVLQSIGLTEARARACVRLSFGRMTTLDEISSIGKLFCERIEMMRKENRG